MVQAIPLDPATRSSLTTVYLGGKLGQLFGAEWKLKVKSPAEAIHAINVNTRGAFRQYISLDGKAQFYSVSIGDPDQTIGENELVNRSGQTSIHITPVPQGQNSGAAKIIAGVVILAFTIWNPFGWAVLATGGAGGLLSGGSLGWVGSIAVGISASLILGGISQLLAPHPKTGGELDSNIFQGTVGPANQGGCVPLVYGRALVSPMTISIQFKNVDYNTSQNAYIGTLEAVGLPGGGTEFVSTDPNAVVGPTNSDPDV